MSCRNFRFCQICWLVRSIYFVSFLFLRKLIVFCLTSWLTFLFVMFISMTDALQCVIEILGWNTPQHKKGVKGGNLFVRSLFLKPFFNFGFWMTPDDIVIYIIFCTCTCTCTMCHVHTCKCSTEIYSWWLKKS